MLEILREANIVGAEEIVWGREVGWPEEVTRQPGVLPPLELDSEHPYLLAYTSGTTGRPKGALHVHGGFLVSIAREAAYQADIHRGDRVFFSTDMGACFLTTCITEPIKPVALGFPALGQAMDVVDAEGRPVRGEVGELVCRRPWPGMTRGIWGDPERYLETYWSRFPGVWTHGDWASVDEDGYWFLHGRSDDTLNIAGKRIGPAELESAAVSHPSVAEAAAVGLPHEVKGEVAWIFSVPREDVVADGEEARQLVAEALGKAFA